jgi:hypothetical protein
VAARKRERVGHWPDPAAASLAGAGALQFDIAEQLDPTATVEDNPIARPHFEAGSDALTGEPGNHFFCHDQASVARSSSVIVRLSSIKRMPAAVGRYQSSPNRVVSRRIGAVVLAR